MNTEERDFLKELQHTMKTQDKDIQAHPRFWVLYDYREEPTSSDYSEETVFHIPKYDESYKIEELYNLILEVNEDEELQIDKKDLEEIEYEIEEENDYFIEKWLQENIDEGVRIVYMGRRERV